MQIDSIELTTDEKVQAILAGLKAKKSRDELAIEVGYKNHRSLDMAMRRQGYYWDADNGMYRKQSERKLASNNLRILEPTGKVGQVVGYFDKGILDFKEIAVRVGFTNHREMASYMKSQGYIWSANKNNYIRETAEDVIDLRDVDTNHECSDLPEVPHFTFEGNAGLDGNLQDYMPYLEWLRENFSGLQSLVGNGNEQEDGNIPRYAVPGVFITKSVHMSNQLDQLVRDFSTEKNLSQRDIFAVALAEFFRKYGYRKQIDTLLASI